MSEVINTPELAHRLDMLTVRIEEREKAAAAQEQLREKAGTAIDWRAMISAAGLATMAVSTIGTMFVGGAINAAFEKELDPLKNSGIRYEGRIDSLENEVAVQSATMVTETEGAIRNAEKLVAQIEQDLERAFSDQDKLNTKIESLETDVTGSISEVRFDEKLSEISAERSRAIERVREGLADDISRLTQVEDETGRNIDDLKDRLAQTLGVAVFEERFTFLREQREDDLAVLREQRKNDQAALFRIIGDRITPRIVTIEHRLDRLDERIQGIALSLSKINQGNNVSYRPGGA